MSRLHGWTGALPPPAPASSSHLLLAISRHVPESVSPALANSGDWNRHRTWYQWVRGSVGAVDSHTVILPSRKRHAFARAAAPTLCTLSSPQASVPRHPGVPWGPGAETGWLSRKLTHSPTAMGHPLTLTYMPRDTVRSREEQSLRTG